MTRLSRLPLIFACGAALASAGCATNSALTPGSGSSTVSQARGGGAPTGPGWIHAGNLVYHVPQYMPTRSAAPAAIPGILFTYYGGNVLTAPKMYIVFWGYKTYGDPYRVKELLTSLCRVQGGSGHNNIYTQYYETVDSSTTFITNPKNQCGGTYDDEVHSIPLAPSGAQIAAEALLAVKKLGYDPNGSYVVATANGRNEGNGFGTQWCSYHSNTYDSGKVVSYTDFPYLPNAGRNCGAYAVPAPKDEKGIDEGVTIVEGMMYGVSVTDPVPGSSWYNFDYGEIGGPCSGQIALDRFGSKSYAMLAMFSNATQSCVQTYK